MPAMIATTVRGRARGAIPRAARGRLVRRLGRAMAAAGVGAAELSLALVDDDEIRALNRRWRRKDRPTDVLSFALDEAATPAGGLPRQRDPKSERGCAATTSLLGDVVISVETAARQAAAAARPLEAELLHLAVHGLAHLCGYDHATVREERVMFGWEAELRAVALGRGAIQIVPRPSRKSD
jgi:probable rRNA maturation factor